MYRNIPAEMRAYKQFVCWRYEKTDTGKDTKLPICPQTGRLASVTDPSTWSTFDEACAAAPKYSGIGFVLTDSDPYACLDLDDTHGDKEAEARQILIYQEFASYAERSPSGAGCHVWIKGRIECGRRRSFVEVYSAGRYLAMTGNVINAAPIEERQKLLALLWAQMGGFQPTIYDGNGPEKEKDEEIIKRALAASNGEKFQTLLSGEWNGNYLSQSEADFAFVDIIAFYTQNADQIARIFRASILGQRAKAKRNDYVSYMIHKSFDKMLPPIDLDGIRNQLNAQIARIQYVPDLEACANPIAPDSTYPCPSGLLGEIARFIYDSAPRQVPEVALAGALGLMAGICGRSYNISGTGLNQYILLLAGTGIGKSAMATGIDKLLAAVAKTVPSVTDFIGPGEIASSQALSKYFDKKSASFVSIVGEYGLFLKQLTAFNAPSNLVGLRKILLAIYSESGEGKVLRPIIYSDHDKNSKEVISPAFSLLGETTPERYFELLDEKMIQDGFLPRFVTINYKGNRPYLNEGHEKVQPSASLISNVAALASNSLLLNNSKQVVVIQYDDYSRKTLYDFERYCTDEINAHRGDLVGAELWNRAHLKVLKIAGLIAAGCNPYHPCLDQCAVDWAIKLICEDVRAMSDKFLKGEIGNGSAETKQVEKLKSIIRNFAVKAWSEIKPYGVLNEKMHSEKILPYKYLNKRLANDSAFSRDKMGAKNALVRTLETLKNCGDIEEIPQGQIKSIYGPIGKCFAIIRID